MRSRLRENGLAIAAGSLALWIVAWLSLYGWALTDYDFEARPSIDALLGGHVLRFLQLAPAYGGSLIIRSPFLLVPKLWGGGELAVYRAAAVPCLVSSLVLGLWLVTQMRSRGNTKLARALTLALCVANPLTLAALELGHPEELLGAVLSAAAVISALRNRPIWAGILLGLAVANKEWALLAVGPVLVGLPCRRRRAVGTAGAVAAGILAPLALAGKFVTAVHSAATQAQVIFNPWQIWWFLGRHEHALRVAGHILPGHRWNHRVAPAWLAAVSHPLIILIMVPLTLLCLYRRHAGRERPKQEALLLLSVLLLLRCMLDPWNMGYYALPFLLALVAWETLAHDRPPVLALATTLAAWMVMQWAAPGRGFSPDMQSVLYLLWALPTLALLSVALYAPQVPERLRPRAGRRVALANAA
jgi:hypothetical protein